MSDFAQPRLITRLQRLNETHLPVIEAELVELARTRSIALVLPCHANDLENPALAHIARELRDAAFLTEIVLSINGAAPRRLPNWARSFTELWIDADGPGVRWRAGKGENVAAAFRHLATQTRCAIFAVQDCDVASFRRQDLARLCYAIAHPNLGFRFGKMYYSRATDRLHGRVSRLFLAPLLVAIDRVAGRLPLVEFLQNFRYPLAGEIALTRELAIELPPQSGWTLELGHLCEVFRHVDPRRVCEVEGGLAYEHRHHRAEPELARMAGAIAGELFSQLARAECGDTTEFYAAILSAFREESKRALRRSRSLAAMNALPFDEPGESALVAIFTAELAQMPLAGK